MKKPGNIETKKTIQGIFSELKQNKTKWEEGI